MMTWLQTALVLAGLALILYGMWRAWSRPDPAFDLTRQYEKAMGALGNWETDAADTQPTVRIVPAEPRCGRCGGVWGEDETCEDCVDDHGNPRPRPRP